MQSMRQTNEKAIGGTVIGQIKLGESVEWRARHFGIYFTMTSRIAELQRPLHFMDEMVKGPFKYLRHQHVFKKTQDGTLMTDLFYFRSPLGIFGYLADKIILERYLKNLLAKRNETIRITAESLNHV